MLVVNAERLAVDHGFGKHDLGSAWFSTPYLYLGNPQAAIELLDGMWSIRYVAGPLIEDRQRPALFLIRHYYMYNNATKRIEDKKDKSWACPFFILKRSI